jgi:hypothetical protein
MTFFLKEPTNLTPRGPNVALPSNASGVGAAITSYFREIDTFNGASARTEMEKVFVGKDAGERLGVDRLNQWYIENDAGYDHLRPAPTSVDDFIEMHGERGADIILDLAREEAAKNPDAWRDIDVSQEGIDTRVTEGLKASDASDSQLLALSPNPIRNTLLGSLAAGVLDPVNLAAIPFGLGGGSILRTMAREAMINGTIEGIQNPTRVKTAERLGKEAPGMIESVVQGAVFGAALGGLLEGVPKALRALSYYREMKKTAPDPTLTPVTQEAAIQSAEKAIVAGKDPLQAVRQAVLAEPAPARRPLILDESLAVTPEPTALAPDPITAAPLPPTPGIQSTTDQIIATAKSGIKKAGAPRKEVLSFFKARGGVDPAGWLGTEMKARGLTAKSFPGLFKKGGIRDVDNIPFDEVDPGIANRVGRAQDGLYLDRDGLLRVFDEEMNPPRAKSYDRDYVPERAWADSDTEDRGFMVDLNARQFVEPDTWRETLDADIDAHIEAKGLTLLPREISEIKQIAATRGGDVEDLVYSAMSREIDEAETATIRSMRGEAYGRSDVPWGEEAGLGRGADRPSGDPAGQPQSATGNAAEPGARGLEPQSERTDAGDQLLIPGTRRVDEYSKHVAKAQAETKALQSAMRSGKPQERVEDDAGGLFGGAQRDMFSDPADPKSKPAQISMMEDVRGTLEAEGDFMVDVGAGPVPASTLLKEMDDDLNFEDILNACGKRGPA